MNITKIAAGFAENLSRENLKKENLNVDVIFCCQCFLSYICENVRVILNIQTHFKRLLKGLIMQKVDFVICTSFITGILV